jgi:hypothetical protein
MRATKDFMQTLPTWKFRVDPRLKKALYGLSTDNQVTLNAARPSLNSKSSSVKSAVGNSKFNEFGMRIDNKYVTDASEKPQDHKPDEQLKEPKSSSPAAEDLSKIFSLLNLKQYWLLMLLILFGGYYTIGLLKMKKY